MISKLTLGTAQLGQLYGIANTAGKPSERIAHEIISTSLHNDITCIDTAPVYGASELIIGEYLSNHPSKCTVVTKIPKLEYPHHTFKEVYPIVKTWLDTSLVGLRMKYIPIYLVHEVSQLDIIYESLLRLKQERLIDKIGVSICEPKELEKSLKFDEIEVFQLPINVFDHRFIPYLPKLSEKIVFARSIFLQGYLFTNNKYTKILRKMCNDFETNIREVAVSFVRDLPKVTSLVIGAETVNQVLDNVELIKSPKLPENLRNYIYKEFTDMPLEVIDPSKWRT